MSCLADRVLARAVEIATGNPDVAPREVQVDLAGRICGAMDAGDGHTLAAAPTGSGKSLAYLVPAALAAVQAGERTVVSTESLSLQAQIIEKDLPVVARAVEEVTGETVTFAVLKGWGNYACGLESVSAAHTLLGFDSDTPTPVTPEGLRVLADKTEASVDGIPSGVRVSGKDGAKVDARELATAAAWGLRATADQSAGDRHSYPGIISDAAWRSISVSASDCVGSNCPLFEYCLPAKAKQKAADAQIVVTNHTLLGIQAAKNVPAVLSSHSLGQFDHIVIDEAHGLPSIVRGQGASAISGRRIGSVRASIYRAVEGWAAASIKYLGKLSPSGTSTSQGANRRSEHIANTKQALADRVAVGFHVADAVDADLARYRDKLDYGGVARLSADDENPMEESGPVVARWVGDMRRVLKEMHPVGYDMELSRTKARLTGRLDALAEAVKAVSEHEVGTARWVESRRDDESLEVKATPVDVAGAIAGNLWTTEEIPDDDEDEKPSADDPKALDGLLADEKGGQQSKDGEGGSEKIPLSVTAVSATLPRGFAREMAMHTKLVRYPSPLDDAYGRSVLHIPKPTNDDVVELTSPFSKNPSRPRFDTKAHADWAQRKLVDLVCANDGAALVLAATAAAGKRYAQKLREVSHDRWQVLSQWDGRLASAVAADWRSDHSAVLVGTRSYMTGLDAPGATCSLVVLDRPPRSAGNPVDDARVEILAENAEISKWDADRKVYVADATVLLEQATGRLLRSVDDSGMVAVLDPRLLKNNPFSYNELTRRAYMKAVDAFGRKISDPGKAVAWLTERAARRSPATGKVA